MCEIDEVTLNTEKTVYAFDCAALSSTGYIEICDNEIHMHYPEISIAAEKPTSNYKNIQIFIDNKICLSFDWLPFYSFYDRIRIMDMFVKSYELFSNMIQGYFYSPYPHSNKPNKTYSNIITQLHVKNAFNIYCLEDCVTTSIQLTLDKQREVKLLDVPFHFKISIGNNIVFSTVRDLQYLEQAHINFIVQFILHKIVHTE
jgi:hypothetical protein